MKNFTARTLMAAAALLAGAVAASAQNMRAEIPFSFSASKAVMAPGGYEVVATRSSAGTPLFKISTADRTVLLIGRISSQPTKQMLETGKASLVFECAAAQCALIGAWTGEPGTPMYAFSHSKSSEPTRLASVELTFYKSE